MNPDDENIRRSLEIAKANNVLMRFKEETEEPEESEGGNTLISLLKAITYIVAVIVISVFLSVFIILVGNDLEIITDFGKEISG